MKPKVPRDYLWKFKFKLEEFDNRTEGTVPIVRNPIVAN